MTIQTKDAFIELAGRLWDEAFPQQPEQPKPAEGAKPVASLSIGGSTDGEWVKGFSKDRNMIAFAATADNKKHLIVGRTMKFASGETRKITGNGTSMGKVWLEYDGTKLAPVDGPVEIYEGQSVPKLEGVSESIVAPAPQAKGRILLNIGLGSGGDWILPGKDGTEYRLPTRRDWEGAAKHGFKSTRLGFLWERMTGGGAPGRGQVNGYFVDRLLKSLEIGREVGMDVSALDMHNYAGYSTTDTSKDRKKIGTSAVPIHALGDDWAAFLTELMKNDVARTMITGIDVMNEPVGIKWDVWKQALQHAVTKIAGVVPDLPIHLEGINYSSTIDWVKNNPTMHEIVHPRGKDFLIPHGHLYLDERASGFWETAKDKADDFQPDDGIKSLQSFYNWCVQNGYKRRAIGETWVPGGFPRSQKSLDNMLGWCIDHGVDVYLWYWSEGANGSIQDMQSAKNRSTLDIALKHLKVSP
ncbi:glycoside hydrolase family 5 protein [Pseudomonas sp. Marseille-QA0892]